MFCKIINNALPSKKVYEDERAVAFYDIHPKAPTHILIVPKEHIVSVASDGSEDTVGDLVKIAKKIAQDHNIAGYKLIFNVGREGGQIIDHLHLHFLAGRMSEMP